MQDSWMIFIVDDDAGIRAAIEALASAHGAACRSFATAEAFLEEVRDDERGCLLLDVRLPGMSGIELLQRLTARNGERPTIMISGQSDIPKAVAAMKLGALEFLVKPFEPGAVNRAIERARSLDEQERSVSGQRDQARGLVDSLTRREAQVLQLIVAGRLNKQMAAELGISQKTVEFHRARVMRKLNVNCMAELMRVAFLSGVRDLYESDERTAEVALEAAAG